MRKIRFTKSNNTGEYYDPEPSRKTAILLGPADCGTAAVHGRHHDHVDPAMFASAEHSRTRHSGDGHMGGADDMGTLQAPAAFRLARLFLLRCLRPCGLESLSCRASLADDRRMVCLQTRAGILLPLPRRRLRTPPVLSFLLQPLRNEIQHLLRGNRSAPRYGVLFLSGSPRPEDPAVDSVRALLRTRYAEQVLHRAAADCVPGRVSPEKRVPETDFLSRSVACSSGLPAGPGPAPRLALEQ